MTKLVSVNVNMSLIKITKWPNFNEMSQAKIGNLISPALVENLRESTILSIFYQERETQGKRQRERDRKIVTKRESKRHTNKETKRATVKERQRERQ